MALVVLVFVSLLLQLLAYGQTQVVRYDGHKVVRVQATTPEQLKWLIDLEQDSNLDFWTHPSLSRSTDILLSPDDYTRLHKQLIDHKFNVTTAIDDVQKLIEDLGQHPHSKRQLRATSQSRDIINEFLTYDEINTWVRNKAYLNKDITTLYNIGKTYENRDTYLLKLGVSGANKSAIWIDSGIHAREWLSVSSAVNIIDKMLNDYRAKDLDVTRLLTQFDWYFLPIANPDGYVYSHTQGGRLWRKTRTQYGNTIGADPNRNYGYQWGTKGVSRSPGSAIYCGPRAWSEKCVQNIKRTMEILQPRLKMFVTLHSYGQKWFVPYAYSKYAYPADYNQLMLIASKSVKAMEQATGVKYEAGRVPDLMYEASGSSMDWVKAVLKTPYAFGLESRPTLDKYHGFIAPASSIQVSAKEIWAGIKTAAQHVFAQTNFIG